MKELQQAIEQACRDIERYMSEQGQGVAVGFKGMNSHQSPVHSELNVLTVELLVKHLGKAEKSPIELVKPFMPDWVKEPDAGYRAGMKALLEKFQQAIQNATDLAEGRPTVTAVQQAAERSEQLRPDDPVPKMLVAVAKLCKAKTEADERIVELEKSLDEKKDPDKQLRDRIKLKMRAKYLEKSKVLREFQTYIFENYSAMFPETVPRGHDGRDVVSEFLERVGDE